MKPPKSQPSPKSPPSLRGGATKQSRKKIIQFFSYSVILLLSFSSCTTDNDIIFGSILFSSNTDCTVRIFDVPGNQLARVEVPHDVTVSADMKHKGIFIVHAVSSSGVVKKETVLFEGGVVDCFIYFGE
ncbi:MAG: hypothetical protein LBE79_09150 [Tannerella sp.]|jgi:WD40 repeat protein|nr:hypothetical protein [Tannerella sp.]